MLSDNIKNLRKNKGFTQEELANKLNIKTQYITRILRGEAKTHNGWTFKYG